MSKTAGVLVLALFIATSANAELYLEASVEGGGEELIGTSHGDNLYTGGGFRIAAGIQQPLAHSPSTLRLTLGYLSDSVSASNGYAEMDALTFDALYMVETGPHRLGLGPTVHMSPRYRDNVNGYTPLELEFDNAVGLLVQYGYQPFPGLEIGARVTSIEYRNPSTRLDAGSFGVYLSNGF
jgi:hypothetical protein